MNYKNVLVVSVLSLVFASSCSVKVEELAEASSEDLPASLTPATLDGTWATICEVEGPDSTVKSFQLADGTLTVATLRYKDSLTCEQAKLHTTVIASGLFSLKDDSSVAGAKNYEWTVQMVAGIPYEQAMVDDMNAESMCGSNTWVAGQAQILLGCQISPTFDLTNVTYGTVHYGLYKIEDAVMPTAQLEEECSVAGYAFVCPTAEDRPSLFDDKVFYKQ